MAEISPHWEHNKKWARQYRDQTDVIVAGMKKLARVIIDGGIIDPKIEVDGEFRGTGNSLVKDFPWIGKVAQTCWNGTKFWDERRKYLENVRRRAELWRDPVALWKVKERYDFLYNRFKTLDEQFRGLAKSAIDERARAIELEWRTQIQPKLRNLEWYNQMISVDAWKTVASDTVIKVVEAGTGIVKTVLPPIIRGAADVGDEVAKTVGVSLLKKPLFWIAVIGGGYLLWKTGVIKWGARVVKRRVGVEGFSTERL